jgi:hypothetical protein
MTIGRCVNQAQLIKLDFIVLFWTNPSLPKHSSERARKRGLRIPGSFKISLRSQLSADLSAALTNMSLPDIQNLCDRHVDLITVALNSVFALLCDHAPNSTTFGNRAYVHKDFKAIMDCTSGTDQDQRWYARRVEGAFR